MPLRTHSHSGNGASGNARAITDVSQTGLDITGDFTFELWLRPAFNDVDGGRRVGGKGTTASGQRGFLVNLDGDGSYRITLSSDGLGSTNNSSAILAEVVEGEWMHLAISYLSGGSAMVQFYVNGRPRGAAGSTGIAAIFDNTSDFTIGTDHEKNLEWQGEISDVRIWDDLRTDAEIFANYQARISTATNLQGSWFFDDDALDETANNNDLSNSGSPIFVSGEVPGFQGNLIPLSADVVPDAPAITNVSPSNRSVLDSDFAQAVSTPVMFDVTDDNGVALSVLTLKYVGINKTFLVHDGTSFVAPFDSVTSSRTVISNGFRYIILPSGGWRSSIETLTINASDTLGTIAT